MRGGQRRLAAIMFTDTVGYSALAQRDEALALRQLDEQRGLLRPLYAQFGGREVKTMGDGALVEFESALHATECAVEMQRRLFERNRGASERIEIRIGIHVGDVVHSEEDVYGDAVNIASRVEPLAEAGGVCVTGPVYEQVQNKLPFPLKPLERAVLKNIETPVAVYRLELPWTPPSLAAATPFTDRKVELDRLVHGLAAAASGDRVALAISGEAGVGKSRLVEELVQRAQHDGARVLRGRGSPDGIGPPFAPWSEAVRDFARDAPNPLLYKVCADCSAEVVRLVPELGTRLGPGPDAGATASASEQRLFEGVLRLLGNLGREGPTVVILDDLQWADGASVRLLEFVVRHLAGTRTLLLVVYRDEDVSTELDATLERIVRERLLEPVRLSRFDRPASEQMLSQMLHGRLSSSGGDLARLLFEKSGGNPMILEAVVRSLVGEGALVWSETGWGTRPGVEIRLPPGVRSIVRRRLEQLDPATVDLLRQASVFGSSFSFEALRRVTELAPEPLLLHLEQAVAARVLEERPVGPGRSVYAFLDHPVVETLYGEISQPRRARYHANAARVLEQLISEGEAVPAAELAHHFLRANEHEKALEYTFRAADEAVRLFAREEALRQYATAAEILDSRPDERRRAELLYRIGVQLDALGRHAEAYRSMREAAELYERLGMAVPAGETHRSIARRIASQNQPARALEHLEKARRLLEAAPPSVELARLYDTMGMLMFQEVRMREATDCYLRAIDIAQRVGALQVDAAARLMLASIVPAGEKSKVWEYLDAALASATTAGARVQVANVLWLRAVALVNVRGDGRGALRAAEDAIDYARQGRDVLTEQLALGGVVTYVQWRLGDLERAERTALDHRAWAGGDPHRERATAISVLAEVALARGEVDRAEKLLWEAERLLAEGGDWTERAQAEIVLGRCARERRKPQLALDHLRSADALAKRAGPPAMDTIWQLETLALFVRNLLDAGDLPGAERHLEALASLARELNEELGEAFRARAQGWVEAQRRSFPAARTQLEASAALWKRLGWQYEWAQTLLDLAEVHRQCGAPDRASVVADQATEYLSKAGAQRDLGPASSTPRR